MSNSYSTHQQSWNSQQQQQQYVPDPNQQRQHHDQGFRNLNDTRPYEFGQAGMVAPTNGGSNQGQQVSQDVNPFDSPYMFRQPQQFNISPTSNSTNTHFTREQNLFSTNGHNRSIGSFQTDQALTNGGHGANPVDINFNPTNSTAPIGGYPMNQSYFSPHDQSPEQFPSGYRQSFSSSSGGSSFGLPGFPTDAEISPPYMATSPMSMSHTSPPSMQNQSQPQQQQRHTATQRKTSSNSASAAPPPKRQRPPDIAAADGKDSDSEGEKDSKRPVGACARCKGLKVKCEFRTDTDPCRRCLNSGNECVLPGRKKRRTPPKREHLLNQIQEQTATIERLMAQLSSSAPRPLAGVSRQQSGSEIHSPGLSAASPQSSQYTASPLMQTNGQVSQADPLANKAVEEWIAKAKESFVEFGGLIAAFEGSGMQRKYVVGEEGDSNSSSEDDGFYTGEEDQPGSNDEYEFAVENADEDEASSQHIRSGVRQLSSVSSVNGSAVTKKKQSEEGKKLVTLPTESSAFGLMASLSLKSKKKSNDDTNAAVGLANNNFFRSNPAPGLDAMQLNSSQPQAPLILSHQIVTIKQAEALFTIYFKYMNLSLSLLDPALYTAQKTALRSPFLFTVVCAIASRYYTDAPGLYSQVMFYAQQAAGTALTHGTKNVELASAYILLSLYSVPSRRFDEDRSFLYLGLALRVAVDLNLQKPNTAKPLNEAHAREMLNRTRVWLNCFNLDRSTGSQHGRVPTIRDTDYMACHSEDWWRSSQYNMTNFDIQLCGYTAELRVMSKFVGKVYSNPNHPTGINKDVDLYRLASETDDELSNLGNHWFPITSLSEDPQNVFRTALLTLAFSYARLTSLSFAFQHASRKSSTDENPFLMRCLRAATDVVNSYLNNVARPNHLIFLRHGPDAQSVFVTFASAFLVKLLQPKFSASLSRDQRKESRELVQKVISVLSSPEVAIDNRHAPKLYSRFLQGLLDTPMAQIDPPASPVANGTSRRVRRPKSAGSRSTPETESKPDGTSNHPSPRSNYSVSPSQPTYTSFDQPMMASHGQMSMHLGAGAPSQGSPVTQTTPEFYEPPLPFDADLLHSMQSLTDPSEWQDITALPHLGWMSNFRVPGSSSATSQPIDESLIFETMLMEPNSNGPMNY